MRKPGDKLKELDSIVANYSRYFSLDPFRIKASTPSVIGFVLTQGLSKQETFFLEDQMTQIVLSQHDNFPENIFWDLEALFSHLCSLNSSKEQKEFTANILDLHEKYGEKNSINFAYVHDFVYGFDWYRWVKKDFAKRKKVKPFDLVFLDYLEKRSLELYELIRNNDAKYPSLKSGVKRNPFGFNRSFREEIRLHLKMAELDFIPWKAWLFKPMIDDSLWEKDMTEERKMLGKKI